MKKCNKLSTIKQVLISTLILLLMVVCCSCNNRTVTPEEEELASNNADYALAMVKIHYSMTGDELIIDDNSIENGILIDPYPEGTTYVEFDSTVKSKSETTNYHNEIAVKNGKMQWKIAIKGTNKYKTIVNNLD